MNLLNRVTARVAGACLLVVASTLTIASAAKTLQPALAISRLSALSSPQPQYLAGQKNRLQFSVGVRSSRFRFSGFSRNPECLENEQALTVIAPPTISQEISETGDSGVDKTISSHPMVFAYIPQQKSPGTQAQFTLEDETGTRQIHKVTFDLPNRSGIVGIQIPSSAPALEQGQDYLWQLAIICDADNRSYDETIDSWITRIAAPPALPTNPQEKAIELANQGIWQDAASTLALLRYPNSSNTSVETDWSALLTSAGLSEKLASAPIVQIVR